MGLGLDVQRQRQAWRRQRPPIRLAPQNDWEVNNSGELRRALSVYESIQASFGGSVSIADGSAAQTDADSFAPLEPTADGFRNFIGKGHTLSAEAMLVDRAQLLTLSAPEMTALVGGLRVLGANTDDSSHGVFTDNVGALSNDFFVNLLDLDTEWSSVGAGEEMFEGRDRASGELKWTGTRNDLVFGSNSQLRAISEIYGSSDSSGRFVNAFVAAWDKVMNLDRFDIS
jgi:catalase-peroxidase